MKKISVKLVLVSYCVHDNDFESYWFLIKEFPTAALLNPSLKSRFM